MGIDKLNTSLVHSFLLSSGFITGVALISAPLPFAYKHLNTASQTFFNGLNAASQKSRLLWDLIFLCIVVAHSKACKDLVVCILVHQPFKFHAQTCIVSRRLCCYCQTHLLDTGHQGHAAHSLPLSKCGKF